MNEVPLSPPMSEQEEIRQLREENALLRQAKKMQEERMLEMKQEHSSSMSEMKESLVQVTQKADRFEREIYLLQKRLNVWQSFFTREFVAVMVGAALLVIFAGFLMVSMYNRIPTTEVITNGFFVLLGFFFSQTAKGLMPKKDDAPESTVRQPSSSMNAADPRATAFVHIATKNNTVQNYTFIDSPPTNNNPNAILIVTQNWSSPSNKGGTYNPHSIGVWYTSEGKWSIFNQDKVEMPLGAAFNVQVLN